MISRENNFDLIRLFAALQVAIVHAFRYLQINELTTTIYGGAFRGVYMFFVISGFLVASSFDRNKNFKRYIRNRLLRIVPALWTAFILLVIVLVYFGFINQRTISNPKLWAWSFGQLTLFQFYTPSILRDFGVGAPNGSLWTISVEFCFYLLLPIFFMIKKHRNASIVLCMFLSITINMLLASHESEGIIYKLVSTSIVSWLYCFLFGSIIYLNWDRIKSFFEGKALIYFLLYLLYVIFISKPSYKLHNVEELGANLLLGMFTISLAYTLPKLGKVLHGFDISYGFYVYHMIVVNVFVQLGRVGKVEYVVESLLISIMMGCLSWKYIEKKALQLKS